MKKNSLVLIAVLFSSLFSAHLMAMEAPKLKCFGTEPFWGLTTKESTLTIDNFGDAATAYKITSVSPAVGTSEGWTTLIKAENQKNKLSLIARQEECNDGMSDEVYAYSAYVQTGDALLVGCCNDN